MKLLSEELNVKENVYDVIEAYMKYKNQHLKIIKEEYESKFNVHRFIEYDEMNICTNKKLGEYPIHK